MLKIKIKIMHTKFRNKTNQQTATAITATNKQNKAKHSKTKQSTGYQYRRAQVELLSSSLSMKKMKSG
jgi:hypothetical protein